MVIAMPRGDKCAHCGHDSYCRSFFGGEQSPDGMMYCWVCWGCWTPEGRRRLENLDRLSALWFAEYVQHLPHTAMRRVPYPESEAT